MGGEEVDLILKTTNIIQEKINSLPPHSSQYCCIYKVPENLRSVNEEAYKPCIVSIGPLHRNDARLKPMEETKLRYLNSFLQRTKVNIEHYVKKIYEWEDFIRGSYVDQVSFNHLDSYEFVEMVLIDAAFFIELMCKSNDTSLIDENDGIFEKPRLIVEVLHDIKLEENQLPFFILRDIYETLPEASDTREEQKPPPFIDIVSKFFKATPRTANTEFEHFVDFLRSCCLPSIIRTSWAHQLRQRCRRKTRKSSKLALCPSVKNLYQAGVKFVPSKSRRLLDISFDPRRGHLEIPRLELADDSESYFRSMMVFEQCHYFSDTYVIDYMMLLDNLINSPEDAEILIKEGIIENWLGTEKDVSKFFANIMKQTRLIRSIFYYYDVCEDLNTYYGKPWNKYKAELKHKYFNHPWAFVSFLYAIVVLLLTIGQFVCGAITL